MTYDKIKNYMQPDIFQYWLNVANNPNLPNKVEIITQARNNLQIEIELKLLTENKHFAELHLLNYLLY